MPTEQLLAYHCGPAFAGIKTANIVSCSRKDNPMLLSEINALNSVLNSRDIYIEALCGCGERVLVMVYRKEKLCDYLRSEKIMELLMKYGYPSKFSLEVYLGILKGRLSTKQPCEFEFPHEIGAFLGYPAHDIYGFVNHRSEGCLLTGEWKVYAEADKAKKTFCRYRACRKALYKRVREGKTLEELFCIA